MQHARTALACDVRQNTDVADPLVSLLDDPASNLSTRAHYQRDTLGQWMRQTQDGLWEKCVPNLAACSCCQLLHVTALLRCPRCT